MVQDATNSLRYEAAHYPHLDKKSIWITELNPSASSWWTSRPWYFQYNALGQAGGELNVADARRIYGAMDRAGTVRTFNRDVVEKLHSSRLERINIRHVFFYDYDSGGESPKCDRIKYSWKTNLQSYCIDGIIDPSTGNLVPRLAAAVAGSGE